MKWDSPKTSPIDDIKTAVALEEKRKKAEYGPRRIQRKRSKGWRMPPNTVYVGRPSKWGNPYTLDHYDIRNADDTPAPKAVQLREARAMAVRDHDAWVGLGYAPYTLEDIRRELGGKNLACWCKLDHECHADTLLAIANSDE